ncbi:MAG: endonuclease [Bacteroidales bacterium]|nr:endonuclease [Bacteroidales bacterium]
MKRVLLIALGLLFIQSLFADIPSGYYTNATSSGYTLKTQLYNIIKDHISVSYTPGVWDAIYTTDIKSNGYVWDMYSDQPGGTPAYDYTLGSDQCGNYSGEGSCYNREHSFPKSWFDDASPMYTELFHLYPTDGYVNGKRNNYPFGEVGSASWTSTNGSKLGTSNYPGYSGTVFEPIDEYKGDFARTYFYMATRYENVISSWPGSAMLNGTNNQCYTDWALSMLIEWHTNDPVSKKEQDRNDAIYAIQHNRNPYIDHPEFVNIIWSGEVSTSSDLEDLSEDAISIYPNPTKGQVNLKFDKKDEINTIKIYNLLGERIIQINMLNKNNYTIDLSKYPKGIYIVQISNEESNRVRKIILK